MTEELPILYVKPDCGWCVEAAGFLAEHGLGYLEKNVNEDPQAFRDMQRKSGQTKAPVLDWHGRILADFGVAELKTFLQQQDARLEDS